MHNLHTRRAARQELRSLRAYARQTGEDIRTLIAVPEPIRAQIERFCRAHPSESGEILEALELRDYMLRLHDRVNHV